MDIHAFTCYEFSIQGYELTAFGSGWRVISDSDIVHQAEDFFSKQMKEKVGEI